MFKVALVTSLLVVTACTGKKDEERVAPPQTMAPVVPASPAMPGSAAATPPPSAPAKLDCERILGQALRDAHFAGKTFEDSPSTSAHTGACRIMKPDGTVEVMLSATCPEERASNVAEVAKGLMAERADSQMLTGVGAAALLHMQAGAQVVTAWDDDSSCQVDLVLPSTLDAATVTKDFLAQLPPK